jgi:Glycosyl transferase family 2
VRILTSLRERLARAIKNRDPAGDRLRNQIGQAIAERRYGLAQRLCGTLPASSLHRQIFELQLLIANSRYADAASFYERAGSQLRSQKSAQGRYFRALIALQRTDDLGRAIHAILENRGDPLFLAAQFPFIRKLDASLRAAVADYVLTAKSLPLNLNICCAQLLLESEAAGRAEEVAHGLQTAKPALRAEVEILRCNLALHTGDAVRAVHHLSEGFESFGFTPVALRNPAKPLLPRNLLASASPIAATLPKVSVIVSCFNAERTIGAALASLQNQSHSDIEIIVVDDHSADGSPQIVEALAASDARITHIRLSANKGTYHARNAGLARASGVFVLAHDSDDWAHPVKVERLVRHLVEHPQKIAVRGRMIRFAQDIGAHHRHTYIRPDFSSLTFRREPVLARAGYFDNVRAGADSEFAYRLQRIFGEDALGDLDELLSVTAYTPGSLSSGGLFRIDIDTGIFSPLRAAYRQAYFDWQENASSLFVSQSARPFPIPPEMNP